MPTRERLVTYGVSTLAVATITVAALLQPWRGESLIEPEAQRIEPPSAPRAAAPARQIDVVFAVDTTGSMSGLIDGAKRTVWSIAGHVRDNDPNADLRIGLVAYRDLGDEYVTRPFPLNGDLDAVFAELSSYRAAGGGDTPENVDAALNDVLHKMAWRDGAKKLVFVVGDAPPASRGEVPTFEVLAREARDKQIVINTIRCGDDRQTQLAWQQIADVAGGRFSTIQQDGGVQQIATPYDKKLAELSARIDRTTVIVGSADERHLYEANVATNAAAPAPAQADRARYYAKKSGARNKSDLVGGYASGAVKLEAVPAAALPEELRPLDKAELAKELKRRQTERTVVEGELAAVAKQREEFLRAEDAKGVHKAGFDAEVKSAIDAQLAN